MPVLGKDCTRTKKNQFETEIPPTALRGIVQVILYISRTVLVFGRDLTLNGMFPGGNSPFKCLLACEVRAANFGSCRHPLHPNEGGGIPVFLL